MKTLETLLAEYKKFGVEFNEEENKITIPETSGFNGMCGMPLKEKLRAEMDENEIDHSQLIWLIQGDYDWKSYFSQIDKERKDDPKDADLRLVKDDNKESMTSQEHDIVDASVFPSGLFTECSDEEFNKINEVMKKYGCMPLPGTYPWSTKQNYAVCCSKEQIPNLIKEIKEIRGVENIQMLDSETLHKIYEESSKKKNAKDEFEALIDSLPEEHKTRFYGMERALKELTFYGVMLDNIIDMIDKAQNYASAKEFIEDFKIENKPILFSVPADSILLYNGIKAAGDDFCKVVAERIRKDLFPYMPIRCMAKVRSDVWGITEVAMSGKHLSDYFEKYSKINQTDEYKSVD